MLTAFNNHTTILSGEPCIHCMIPSGRVGEGGGVCLTAGHPRPLACNNVDLQHLRIAGTTSTLGYISVFLIN